MSSRWKANIGPVRPTPVCASSTISSMPRSRQRSRQRREVAVGQVDDPAAGQDRLGDECGQATGGLPVDQVEAVVELGAPVQGAVGVRNRGR